jgi:methionyl-tRNA formyltransferase
MRIVFMGASDLGWECCQKLLDIGQDIVGIYSIPQQFDISWANSTVKNVRFKSFDDLAKKHSIPITYVTQKMPKYKDSLVELAPDVIIAIGWYYMIPRSLRELAPLGAVGVHASLLPKYRGGAPLVWAIINGEINAGVSLFHFDDGVDDGDIIGQSKFEIALEETISDIVEKSIVASLELVAEYIPRLVDGTVPRIQQDHSKATFVSQRQPEDGGIDWNSLSSLQAYNWIRAQTHPYPGAFTYLGNQKIYLWKAKIYKGQCSKPVPGSIFTSWSMEENKFIVCCADGALLEIIEVGLEDGTKISGHSYMKSKKIEAGMALQNERGG